MIDAPYPGTMHVDGHLGGYIVGGDEATFYPNLWKWLVESQGVRTMIDVGCGDGQALNYFNALGCVGIGIDGVPQFQDDIFEHDYTMGEWNGSLGRAWPRADLVWSCEFVEHVEERYMANFLHTFKLGDLLLMTHAAPGQNGHHHVNCQAAEYWIGALAASGFAHDRAFTQTCRSLASINTSPWNHFARSGLAFRRQA